MSGRPRLRFSSSSISMLRQQYPLLLLLAAMFIQIEAFPRVIVSFTQDAVAAAAAVGAASAGANVAAAAASAAAEARGASAARQAAVAKLAAEAAVAQAAVASLSSQVQASAASAGLSIQQEALYSTVLQGAAYSAADAAAAAKLKQQLEQRPEVERVWLAGKVHLPEPVGGTAGTSSPAAAAAAAPQQASTTATSGNAITTGLANVAAVAGPGINGTGQLICIIDTGCNYQLSMYGCTGINQPPESCLVVAGYDFVGNSYDGTRAGPANAPDSDPVASVAATSNGVAPGARLGVYKIFGCSGFSTDDVVIEALDRAVQDGCDVINLSLSGGSGYAEYSVYTPVMKVALAKGVLVVKAAGNSGRDGGPFTSDVTTAVGAVTVASVGDGERQVPPDVLLTMSSFSSYGPSATLELSPQVAAPGSWIPAISSKGESVLVQGTSFSSPYVAGVLALWLQYKQQQAAAAGQVLDPASVNQDAAMRALVGTAHGVPDKVIQGYLTSVASEGAGVIQADALLFNQLSVEPMMLSLPSGLKRTYTTSIKLTWTGPRNPGKDRVTYNMQHRPATAITLTNGWYGTDQMRPEYVSAKVMFSPAKVTLNTATPGASETVKVTFTFPSSLTSSARLYSGMIIAVPAAGSSSTNPTPPAVWTLSVPYMGYTRDWSRVPLLAEPMSNMNVPGSYSSILSKYQATLCYAPYSKPKFAGSILDNDVPVDSVCDQLATQSTQILNVSLGVLQASPQCSLRIVIVNEVPAQRLYIQLMDPATNTRIYTFHPLDIGAGSSIADAKDVWSTCINFDGSYITTAANGVRYRAFIKPGTLYRLNAVYTGPLAAADAALGKTARNTSVPIRGRFYVTR